VLVAVPKVDGQPDEQPNQKHRPLLIANCVIKYKLVSNLSTASFFWNVTTAMIIRGQDEHQVGKLVAEDAIVALINRSGSSAINNYNITYLRMIYSKKNTLNNGKHKGPFSTIHIFCK
jgi:hypothetical protein